jgi:hypothetical protein
MIFVDLEDRYHFEDSDLYEEDNWDRGSWETEEREYDIEWDWDPANDHYGELIEIILKATRIEGKILCLKLRNSRSFHGLFRGIKH